MADKTATKPWQPASILVVPASIKAKYPGKRLRWIRKTDLDRKMAEGWELAEGQDKTERTVIDGAQTDSRITKRELILCIMPEDTAKSRDAYYAEKTASALESSVDEYKRKAGGEKETYGNITITKEGG
jgi:hypothetical protein